MIIGEFVFGAAFNSEEDIRGGAGPLGTDYTVNVDTRFTDTTPGPLVTTVDCSGADAAGGGFCGHSGHYTRFRDSSCINAGWILLSLRGGRSRESSTSALAFRWQTGQWKARALLTQKRSPT